jgi:hypothetical protein
MDERRAAAVAADEAARALAERRREKSRRQVERQRVRTQRQLQALKELAAKAEASDAVEFRLTPLPKGSTSGGGGAQDGDDCNGGPLTLRSKKRDFGGRSDVHATTRSGPDDEAHGDSCSSRTQSDDSSSTDADASIDADVPTPDGDSTRVRLPPIRGAQKPSASTVAGGGGDKDSGAMCHNNLKSTTAPPSPRRGSNSSVVGGSGPDQAPPDGSTPVVANAITVATTAVIAGATRDRDRHINYNQPYESPATLRRRRLGSPGGSPNRAGRLGSTSNGSHHHYERPYSSSGRHDGDNSGLSGHRGDATRGSPHVAVNANCLVGVGVGGETLSVLPPNLKTDRGGAATTATRQWLTNSAAPPRTMVVDVLATSNAEAYEVAAAGLTVNSILSLLQQRQQLLGGRTSSGSMAAAAGAVTGGGGSGPSSPLLTRTSSNAMMIAHNRHHSSRALLETNPISALGVSPEQQSRLLRSIMTSDDEARRLEELQRRAVDAKRTRSRLVAQLRARIADRGAAIAASGANNGGDCSSWLPAGMETVVGAGLDGTFGTLDAGTTPAVAGRTT